jgi:NADH-quinone oxidoreductase subunit E/NADP-reducing hydrogenase subunit HndA
MPFERDTLESPVWWQRLDEKIAVEKELNRDHVQGALIPVLHHVQDTFGYIPPKAINHVAQALGVPTVYVMGVASFYSYFSLEPQGAYTISVCMGTACYVRGAQAVLDEFCRHLGIQPGETTSDGLFTLAEARCVGACGQAPAVMVNERVHARVTPEQVPDIVTYYTELAHAESSPAPA